MSFTQEKQQTEIHRKSNAGRKNHTGIPIDMKTQYEKLSGFSFDDVRVHYNSDKPAQLQALAYTQGNQVFIGPGQETYLGHELGHVVQQKQGIVHPTKMINKIPVNDDPRLEAQCDTMINMAPTMQYRFDGQNNNNITVQLFGFRGADCNNLNDVVVKLQQMISSGLKVPQFDNIDNINKLICIDGEGSLDLSDITGEIEDLKPIGTKIKNYFDNIGKLKLLKKFYLWYFSEKHYIPQKADLQRNSKFTQNFSDINRMLPSQIFKKIDECASAPGMIDFFYALQYHSDMVRVDFRDGEDIDPNDITDTFNSNKSCVITALLYAEGTVFGVTEPRKLHEILVTYFSDYKNSQGEAVENIKNQVWKNYSDSHVYPKLFEYLGYDEMLVSSKTLNQISTISEIINKKGIVVVEGHAIGYKLERSGRQLSLSLKDNERQDDTDGLLSAHGRKKIKAIYKK